MLIEDFRAHMLADNYAELIHSIVWFRMYCVGEMGGTTISNYREGFSRIKGNYQELFYLEDLPWQVSQVVEPVFLEIEEILDKHRISSQKIAEIRKLLYGIEVKFSGNLKEITLSTLINKGIKQSLTKPLFDAIYPLMESDQYDAAIVAAFKYLDSYTREKLNIDDRDLYGEKLINYVFAPDTGLLQLDSHKNEQAGLRNMVSGLNALYRNPSAHRFEKRDWVSTSTVIFMISEIIGIIDKSVDKKMMYDN